MRSVLELSDGSKYYGDHFGSNKVVSGEVVFNTSMVGYIESLTDPSYKKQILVLTYPLIGNYGVPSKCKDKFNLLEKFESDNIQIEGLIVSENVEVIKGNWRSGNLTDLDLLNIYNESILCILPIQETVQPSGQSVALQAISAKVPVIITKTSGFWDSKNFIHNKNIIFIKKNEIDLWKKQIELIVNDLKFLDNISKNAYKTISENYKNTDYFKKLKGLVIQ